MSAHKFAVGDSVRYSSGTVGRPGDGGDYKIIRLLPAEGEERRYRIKSANETHERVALESQLDRRA